MKRANKKTTNTKLKLQKTNNLLKLTKIKIQIECIYIIHIYWIFISI